MRRLSVLLVENDHLFRQAIELYLKRAGHQVYSAWTVDGAIKSLKVERDIDVVLLDVMMNGSGEMGGLRVAGKTPRDIPIIVLSGYNESVIRDEAARNPLTGVVRWMTKPFALEELEDVLDGIGAMHNSEPPPPV